MNLVMDFNFVMLECEGGGWIILGVGISVVCFCYCVMMFIIEIVKFGYIKF